MGAGAAVPASTVATASATRDFSKFNMGTRSQRYSMLVVDGVVKQLNVEQGGKFEVSNAETLLGQLA